MSKTVKAHIGSGENRIEFELIPEQTAKVKRLQEHFKLQNEERTLAKIENRKLRPVKY